MRKGQCKLPPWRQNLHDHKRATNDNTKNTPPNAGPGLGVVGWMSGDPEAGIGWETVHVCLFRSPKPGKDPYIMALRGPFLGSCRPPQRTPPRYKKGRLDVPMNKTKSARGQRSANYSPQTKSGSSPGLCRLKWFSHF